MEESKESGARRPEEAAQVKHTVPGARILSPDVERLAKLVAGVVLLMYLTGLFGVNGYLYKLGRLTLL